MIKNTKNTYRYLSKRTAQWRRDSILRKSKNSKYRLPIDCFSDEKRVVIRDWSDYIKPIDYVRGRIDSLRDLHKEYPNTIPYWYGQPNYVEVWIEKNAMVASIKRILASKHVRIVPLSGYSSVTFMHENMTRLEENCIYREELGGEVHVLYLGDLDDRRGYRV